MTLLEYIKLKGANHHLATYDLVECWMISLGSTDGDKFTKYVAVFPDSPDTLIVIRLGKYGYCIDSHSTTIDEQYKEESKFRKRYLKFIEDLKANEIMFTLNEKDYGIFF